MQDHALTRRHVLQGVGALSLAGALPSAPAAAAAPAPTKVTPELIAAAQKEGKVVWYTAVDLPVAERIAKAFEARYPGIAMRVERSGGERIFQRIGQEYASKIHAVDVVNSSDAAHFIIWKREGILAPFVPDDVAQHYPAEHRDPDGLYATWRSWLCVIGYNTKLVKAEEAPKSYADLLDPKWTGKIVKAHPGYSGTIMTATFQISRDIGWDFFEKLAKQKIMQVQSSADPPKKLALGERAIMADGNEYNMFRLKEKGDPVEIVYPTEGTPVIVGPSGVLKDAPNPNAARLAQCFMFSPECQQLMVDWGGLRSFHALVKDKPGRKPLKEIKLMKDDAAAVEKQADEIKAHYTRIFKV
ncbi:MAG TPA: extracellular solute-binding protein [Hyphomicrobiaceae bacterium]|jgi:iron(III) transport system substrate-binding protein|nr:extracellular solute-binding protein [Hyphomicrobiaceae bacterium]